MSKNLPLLFLLLSVSAFAQTTTYQSSTGTVMSGNQTYGNLDAGGSFASPNSMGGGCYYGSCPDWTFADYTLSYVLPDGTTATFNNFTGSADFTLASDVKVRGTASGIDSKGTPVQVSIDWDWAARCRSGRGGGCSKKFLGGQMSVTK